MLSEAGELSSTDDIRYLAGFREDNLKAGLAFIEESLFFSISGYGTILFETLCSASVPQRQH